MNRLVVCVAWGLLLAGCPDAPVPCAEGLARCGEACVDLAGASEHCGACGVVCGDTQACVEGACRCRPGTTACGEACVVPASDPSHCGGCAGQGGAVCAAEQVCQQGQCVADCSGAFQRCGRACVEVATDAFHCGACGAVCADVRSCHGGTCAYDVVAACFNTGQVVGIQVGTDARGPGTAVGVYPQSVARMQDVLLVLDAATRLRQVRLADHEVLPAQNATALVPNQLVVRDPYVLILNSSSNTLQVLRRDARPRPAEGLLLTDVASVNFGPNTNPYALAELGSDVFVTLYGNLQGNPAAGGRVARVSMADPLAPRVEDVFVLPTGEALRPFPGHETLPTPTGIAALRGRLYVTLNNLDPRDYSPGGPGLLARIDPDTRAVDLLDLGADCLNPGWVAPVGERLVVSCGGRARYDASFNLIGVESTGLVLLEADGSVLDSLVLSCPQDTSCALPSAGRFAVVGSRIYVGDVNAGRIFVVEVVGEALVARRGLDTVEPPLLACPRSNGPSLVGDVVALP